MSLVRPQLKFALLSGMLLWPIASLSDSLLPSQDQPTFFNVRICRDRQVLSALKVAASSTLKADVIVAHGKGSKWSGYDPNDIHLEAVSVSPNDESNSVFCSVTISAKGITERIVYVVSGTLGSWHIRFGGESGSEMGGHALFPEGPITVEPTKRND
jgi:hypothetical protein